VPDLSKEMLEALGLTAAPPGVPEIKSNAKISRLATVDSSSARRRLRLKEEDKKRVTDLLWDCFQEWDRNTSLLRAMLLKYNNRLEGRSNPRDDPWPGACSLMVPLIEMHLLGLHSLIRSTILDNDPIWFAKQLSPPSATGGGEVDPNIEWFLDYKAKKELHIDESISEAILNALATPLSIGCMDWVEERGKEYRVDVFESLDQFQNAFPSAEEAGVSREKYASIVRDLLSGAYPDGFPLKVEEEVVRYRGPKLRIVELKDFVRSPVDAPSLEYTVFHGDQYRQRANYFRLSAHRDFFDPEEVEKMLKFPGETSPMDTIAMNQNRNEGLGGSLLRKSDEYFPVRGNLRIDLNRDDEEELYHVVFHPKTRSLLRIEEYPYWHNRINYIPFKMRKKTNRLQGRCLADMLWDLNEEVDTQHHLRVDSRAVATVPSFKKSMAETDLDLSRKDQHFYPGVVFTVKDTVKGFMQLEVKQTDMGTSLQEEQTLFQIAEWLVGYSPSLRAGTPQSKDPRASGRKAALQIQQSNVRVDDYIKEFMPSINEVGSQMLELYYQFSPSSVIPYAKYDASSAQWLSSEIQRVKLRNKSMTVQVARTSVLDNPDAVLQRALVIYQLLSREPLIGGVMNRRHELLKRTLFAWREKDVSKLLPPLEQIMREMRSQQQGAMADPAFSQMHQALLGKTDAGASESNGAVGKRQGSPDASVATLQKKSGLP
jgi:hypothetical protein